GPKGIAGQPEVRVRFVYPISRTLKKFFYANELGQDLGSRWRTRQDSNL
ncbi:uncharacterized protein METZ01_LOCUS496213, partial [marine metagenome]